MEVVALMVTARFKSKRQALVDLFSVGSALESEEPLPYSESDLNTLDVRTGTFLRHIESWFGPTNMFVRKTVCSPMNLHTDYFSGFVGIGVRDKKSGVTTYRVLSSYDGISEGTSKREHVILVLDKNIQTGRKTERDSAAYAIVNPFDAYYVISPDKSLRQDQCQEKSGLAKYLEKKLREGCGNMLEMSF
ncbi:hypothetical protein Tco_0951641 [Tanacetum coccineum]|uniref:Uncharacterized protein n=1 Tax=Tanacetum coccineum TaxID=301880 RepID=A0ABQ5DUR9_9ASTR